MDSLSFPLHNDLYLVVGPHAAQVQMLELAARLASQIALRVLDGGNRFNVYVVAQAIRRRTAEVPRALERIRVARAFTCYQMVTLLAGTPELDQPTLVLDLLATFYDENVRLGEAQRLLEECLLHLRRLSGGAPVVVSARPPLAAQPERLTLLYALQDAAADVAIWPDARPEPSRQMVLWD
jgi:hypothetical protein